MESVIGDPLPRGPGLSASNASSADVRRPEGPLELPTSALLAGYVVPTLPKVRANGSSWQAYGQIAQFVLGARDPEEVLTRATSALGLLPQVYAAGLTFRTTDDRSALQLDLDAANEGPGLSNEPSAPRCLRVTLADPEDHDGREMVRSLLALVHQIYRRERESSRLASEAHRDPLTGLWNRRGFTSFLDQALARSARTGEDVALLLCDLDYFKPINDELGHDAGDAALRAVARAIEGAIRPSDLAARLGGDELVVLLSGASAKGATHVARRIRAALRRANPLAPRPLTLSIGIADTHAAVLDTEDGSASSRLLRAADEALYQAKAAGRDRAAVHPTCGDRPEPKSIGPTETFRTV